MLQEKKSKKIFFAAGGSGGHIMPAIALFQEIKKINPEIDIVFLGVGKEVEEKIYLENNLKFELIYFPPIVGRGVIGLIKASLVLPMSLLRGLFLFFKYRPKVVVGFGGYPSFIPFVCGFLLRIPRVLQEQNAKVGLSNKILSNISNLIFASPGTKGFSSKNLRKVKWLANPVRQEFDENINSNPQKVILVCGGSQGAVSLNTAVVECSDVFKNYGYKVVHQCGSKDLSRIRELYQQKDFNQVECLDFIKNFSTKLAEASLIISRAGAMTVAEILYSARPALFVPLNISRGHQKDNIENYKDFGAYEVVEQDQDFEVNFKKTLVKMLSSLGTYAQNSKKLKFATENNEISSRVEISQSILSYVDRFKKLR